MSLHFVGVLNFSSYLAPKGAPPEDAGLLTWPLTWGPHMGRDLALPVDAWSPSNMSPMASEPVTPPLAACQAADMIDSWDPGNRPAASSPGSALPARWAGRAGSEALERNWRLKP